MYVFHSLNSCVHLVARFSHSSANNGWSRKYMHNGVMQAQLTVFQQLSSVWNPNIGMGYNHHVCVFLCVNMSTVHDTKLYSLTCLYFQRIHKLCIHHFCVYRSLYCESSISIDRVKTGAYPSGCIAFLRMGDISYYNQASSSNKFHKDSSVHSKTQM